MEPKPLPAVDVLLPRIDELAAAMMTRCAVEIPAYRLLPASVVEGDLVANARAVLELFFTTLTANRGPTDEELALPVAWGAERARDGLPLDAVLQIYPLAAREAWTFAAEGNRVDMNDLGGRILDFLTIVMPRVAAAYLREREAIDWEQRDSRQNLAGTLLAGRPVQRAAERSGRKLADRYHVVVFHFPLATLEAGSRAATDLFRTIQSGLDAEHDVLATFERDGGVLLVPGKPARVPALLSRIDKAAHSSCTAGAAAADVHADIPAAHREAAEILALAENLHRGPGCYWLGDLAIEYQLAQPSPARASLARILAPLKDHAHLIEALRAFITTGYSRGAAAAALNIHRNTLTYRLGRIHTLTGYDATKPTDARQLAAAMTAYDITTPRTIGFRL